MSKGSFTLAVLLFAGLLKAQTDCASLPAEASSSLAGDIRFLASDALEGREPGTKGAAQAYRYIAEAFREAGLSPWDEQGYYQEFNISKEVLYEGKGNHLIIDGKALAIPSGAFPLPYSSNGRASGMTVFTGFGISATGKGFDDYKDKEPRELEGKIFVMDISSPDGIHPHSEYLEYHNLGDRVSLAREKGAVAVLFINMEGNASDPRPDYRNITAKDIPVYFVQDAEVALSLKERSREVTLSARLEEQTVEAVNVAGWVNRGAEQTVIIGAHYDHLGWGGTSSLYREEEPRIHNGADDNASGTAGLLALARYIVGDDSYDHYNYLFVAFSGEEMGLLGSSWFVKNALADPAAVVYMLNMDMIGRLENNQLAVNGTGTSPAWEDVLEKANCEKLEIKTSESGVGPSDHTSFYYKDIPVLHFFTGTHSDYHKPTDDFEKINVEGTRRVLNFMLSIISRMEDREAPEFALTAEEDLSNVPRFTVTLGVLPDYMYAGEGMKIDGVTEGKPAGKAGMKAGDIVIRMGAVKVEDMMSYMKALAQFKKGDRTEVEFRRGDQILTTEVQF